MPDDPSHKPSTWYQVHFIPVPEPVVQVRLSQLYHRAKINICVPVCVCVCAWGRDREKGVEWSNFRKWHPCWSVINITGNHTLILLGSHHSVEWHRRNIWWTGGFYKSTFHRDTSLGFALKKKKSKWCWVLAIMREIYIILYETKPAALLNKPDYSEDFKHQNVPCRAYRKDHGLDWLITKWPPNLVHCYNKLPQNRKEWYKRKNSALHWCL